MVNLARVALRTLTDEDILQVHKATLAILQQIGISIEDEGTRQMLRQKGCKEAAGGKLSFDEEIVQSAIDSVPPQLKLYDRDGELAVDTGNPALQLCPTLNCMNILDHETGEHRPTLLADIEKTARVCDRLPNFRLLHSMGTPTDVQPEEEALATARAMGGNSKKPVGFTGHVLASVEEIWHYFATLMGGWESLGEKPTALDLIGPSSPLRMGKQECRRLRFAAKRHLPVACWSGLIPGATGPMTLAGSLAQAMAESLAGLVIHQMEGPGAPFISGAVLLPMEMRTGALALGSPEYTLSGMAAADYLSHLGVPAWIGAGLSDAHTIDAQAVMETTMNILMAALSGSALIRNLGGLSACKTGSLEMLVLCDEIAGMANRMAAGVKVDEETLALDVIKRAHESTDFITDSHTLKHVRSEMWIPEFLQRTSFDVWQGLEGQSIAEKIKKKLKRLLENKGQK